MHRRLRRDLDPINLPRLPEKRYFNMNPDFIEVRLRNLHEYLKSVILIYEALENPILQRFLEIDVAYDPHFEYAPIEFSKGKETKSKKKEVKKESEVNQTVQPKMDRLEVRKSRRSRKNSANYSPNLRRKSSKRKAKERMRRKPESFKKSERGTFMKEIQKSKKSDLENSVEFLPEEFEK